MGRPPKSTKFNAQIAFQCFQTQKDAVEAYRATNGMRSEGEAVRDLIDKGTGSKPPKGKK